jgi:hypothetical protein
VSSALGCYAAALRRAAAGHETELHLVDPQAARPVRRLTPQDWCAALLVHIAVQLPVIRRGLSAAPPPSR